MKAPVKVGGLSTSPASLFKIDFYPEKYLPIFEDIFDTDVISNILVL